MSYQPEPSSVAARVIASLKAKPAGAMATNAELSRQLGVPASSFAGCLTSAMNAGLVHKRWIDDAGGRGTICWVLGPPVVAQAVPVARTQDLAPEDSANAACPPAPEPPPAADPVAAEIKAILDTQEVAHPAAAGFACALFNDGRLYLELGDETMTLQVEHTRALLAYLERVAMP